MKFRTAVKKAGSPKRHIHAPDTSPSARMTNIRFAGFNQMRRAPVIFSSHSQGLHKFARRVPAIPNADAIAW